MFYYFFEDYKETVYKGSRRKLKWYEYLMIITLFILILSLTITFSINAHSMYKFIFFSLLVANAVIISLYTDSRMKNNRAELLRNYKEKHIDGLVNILKSEKYNLYNIESIDWLVSCCKNRELQNEGIKVINTIKRFFSATIFPILTLCLGLVLKELSTNDIISFTLMMVTLATMVFGMCLTLKPIVVFMLYPEKSIVQYLHDELGYVKTQISKSHE